MSATKKKKNEKIQWVKNGKIQGWVMVWIITSVFFLLLVAGFFVKSVQTAWGPLGGYVIGFLTIMHGGYGITSNLRRRWQYRYNAGVSDEEEMVD